MLSQKAANDYERAQLILKFANLVHPDGSKTQVVTRLVDVDNARESVQAGRILGLPHPNYSRVSIGLRAIGATDPVLSYALLSALFVRDKEYKRAIEYSAGTDMTLTVENPVKFQGRSDLAPDASAMPAPPDPALIEFAQSQPIRTRNDGPHALRSHQPAVHRQPGRGGERVSQCRLVGGRRAQPEVRSEDVCGRRRSEEYRHAPVSLLLLQGRKPDVVYQKQNDTFAKRHHIRIWKASTTFQNSEVSIGAATHDIGVAVQKGGRESVPSNRS